MTLLAIVDGTHLCLLPPRLRGVLRSAARGGGGGGGGIVIVRPPVATATAMTTPTTMTTTTTTTTSSTMRIDDGQGGWWRRKGRRPSSAAAEGRPPVPRPAVSSRRWGVRGAHGGILPREEEDEGEVDECGGGGADGDLRGAGSCLVHDFFGIAVSEQCLVVPRLDYDYDDGVDDGKDEEGSSAPQWRLRGELLLLSVLGNLFLTRGIGMITSDRTRRNLGIIVGVGGATMTTTTRSEAGVDDDDGVAPIVVVVVPPLEQINCTGNCSTSIVFNLGINTTLSRSGLKILQSFVGHEIWQNTTKLCGSE
jgi:hypothetical protein